MSLRAVLVSPEDDFRGLETVWWESARVGGHPWSRQEDRMHKRLLATTHVLL